MGSACPLGRKWLQVEITSRCKDPEVGVWLECLNVKPRGRVTIVFERLVGEEIDQTYHMAGALSCLEMLSFILKENEAMRKFNKQK